VPGCVLRVSASKRNIEAFLSRAKSIKPYSVLFKGQPVIPGGSRLARETGLKILVSGADGNLKREASDALRFLRRHAADLKLLNELLGPGHMQLDFGLWEISSEERPWPTFRLSSQLIIEAARYGCEIELSFYGPPGSE
jgi:hypothetical protein